LTVLSFELTHVAGTDSIMNMSIHLWPPIEITKSLFGMSFMRYGDQIEEQKVQTAVSLKDEAVLKGILHFFGNRLILPLPQN